MRTHRSGWRRLVASLSVWGLFGVAPLLPCKGAGGIQGLVLNAEGKPVAGATVSAMELSRPLVGKEPTAVSDEKGHFLIDGLGPGPYMLSAIKDEDNYPDTADYFYAQDRPPVTVVREGEVSESVVLRFHQKAARLIGKVLDAKAGKAISNASISMTRMDGTEAWRGSSLGSTGELNVLIPPDRLVRIEINAPGYQTWYYGSDGTKEHAIPLKLASNTTKEMVIRLRPLETAR